MELLSKLEAVLAHYKDGELAAITHSNGRTRLLKVTEMDRKDYEQFYEVDKQQKT